MARVMYFESNRSSDAGMLAVGTVVMNRLKSGRYGNSVCEVVGAPNQFAPGVLVRPMTDSGAPRARRMADLVLSGARHPAAKEAQFFHTYGYRYPYRNMKYTLVAGGNAFYEKRQPPRDWFGGEGRWPGPPTPSERVMIAHADPYESRSLRDAPESVVASSAPQPSFPTAPVARRSAPPIVDREIQVASVSQANYPPPAPMPRVASIAPRPIAPSREYEVAAAEPAAVPQYEPAPARVRTPRVIEREPMPIEADAGAIPDYEPRPAARPAKAPRPQYQQVAQAELPPVYDAPRRDWRDEPRARSTASIETRPLPAPVESRPLAAPERPTRMATRDAYPPAPAPTRRVAADTPPAALGWQVGPQPVADYDAPTGRTERGY